MVLLATPDSLFRIATGDGAVRRRVRAPGPVVSPWIRMRDALVAGTADSLVVAIDPDSLTTRWKVRLDAPVMDSPAVAGDTVYAATRRGTLYRVLPGTPARAERIVELDWPITAPVTVVHGLILLGGADGTIRALDPNGTERWRITPLAPDRARDPCRSTTAWWRWAAEGTCIGSADEPPRHRVPGLGLAAAPATAAAQDSPPLVRYGKWLLAAGAVGFNLLAAESHQNADDAFNTLEHLCFENFDRCDLGPDGTYLNPQIEALYQTSLHYDRETEDLAHHRRDGARRLRDDVRLGAHSSHRQAGQHPIRAGSAEPEAWDRDRTADCLVGPAGSGARPSAGPEQLDRPGIATHRPLPQPLVLRPLQRRVGAR